VSGTHARVARGRITDLGSRNGIAVRGRRVYGRSRIRAGDMVRVGDSVIAVRDPLVETDTKAGKTSAAFGVASGGAASLTMVVFALATGHWLLGLCALAVPLSAAGVAFARSRSHSPAATIDITATLGLEPFPQGPVAVSGPRGLVRAVTLATGRPAASAPQWEPWMANLPRATREVTWLELGQEAPSWAEVVVRAAHGTVSVAAHGQTTVAPLPLVSAAHADATARRIAARGDAKALPTHVRWGQLPRPSGQLPVRLGMGVRGPVVLDLVADGPHVLVAGTTGSGKSEALRTIVASLAHDLSPREVNFALLDFKGGAGLGPCANLPHVGSILTDLEPHLARRCLLALAAELADRKRAAARAGASSYEEWEGARPPRLVVVVDEFQEIATADRDFLPQLARLAAQGRSLGIHLVLATQRPAGAVGAEIRANVSATLALRTASESESRDLIGSAEAAQIPQDTPGRAVLMRGGSLEKVQTARAVADEPPRIWPADEQPPVGRSLIDAARERHRGRAQPLWLPPLPALIAPGSGWQLGVSDLPERRSRAALAWDPAAGPLVVTGPPRSGRTSALLAVCALAESAGLTPVWVPRDPRLATRTMALAMDTPRAVLVIDDAARTLAGAVGADPEAPELLATAMHRLPTALVVPAAWASHRMTSSAGLRLVLTGLTEQDDAAWEVSRELRSVPSLPGRVRAHDASGWREAQLAIPGRWVARPLARPLPTEVTGPLPRHCLGIGGDDAAPLVLPAVAAAVVGPAGPERDAVATRVQVATGIPPVSAESTFALGGPGAPAPRLVVIVRPTLRSVREVARDATNGLVEPAHIPMRCVVIADGVASAVQVLAG